MAARRARAKRGRDKAHREFVSEAEEILERMRGDLSDLQEQRDAGPAEPDPELINRLFRSAHSLKGLAGMFGLDAMGELAHHLEDVLDGLRLGRLGLSAAVTSLLEEAIALFAAQLEQSGEADEAGEGSRAVAGLVERIDAAVQVRPAGRDELAELDLDPALLRALTEYEEHRLRENLRRGRHLCLVDTTFEIIAFEEGLEELSTAVREVGEVVSTLPSPGEAPESQIRFSLLVATDVSPDELEQRLGMSSISVRSVWRARSPERAPAPAERAPAPAEREAPERSAEGAPQAAAPPSQQSEAAAEIESLKSISETVRVDIRKLDELMNLVGELMIHRGAVASIASRLVAEPSTARVGAELTKVNKGLERKLKELQSGVLEVRMVPLRQVFEKLSRVVRRLRRDQGKDVAIEFKGSDTELDKLIVEDLIDPLMHVVRNAFDHAIEPAEERVAAGKAAQGSIRVEAFQRGNHVVIEVADDGRGLDPGEVRRIAEAKGLIPGDAVLGRKEILDLVFAAGFSTREQVSETSGRGVGLDVVRSNLTALGGVVDIDSVPGRGTVLTMTLPITLAIIQALVVGVGDQRFAVPLNAVLETLRVEAQRIQHSEGKEILNLRGEPLPLRRLAQEFGLRTAPAGSRPFVVVLGLGGLRMGLVVDRLEGQQDTVIKPINGPIRQIRGIAGATELGDRGAILVLDPSSLVEDAARRREAA